MYLHGENVKVHIIITKLYPSMLEISTVMSVPLKKNLLCVETFNKQEHIKSNDDMKCAADRFSSSQNNDF